MSLFKVDPPPFDDNLLFRQEDTYVSASEMLETLIKTFERAAASKSMATTLFVDPKGIGNASEHQKIKIKEI